MQASFQSYTLNFITPGGTSRGVLHTKETFILTIEKDGKKAVGECALFRGLSSDDVPSYEEKLQWLCEHIHLPQKELLESLRDFPSIAIGYEQALLNLEHGADLYFPSDFTLGKDSIPINGLIWMGDRAYMEKQIKEKLSSGFHCLKLKIGTDWPVEHEVLKSLRKTFPETELELRVDANGAFSFEEAKRVLDKLNALEVHSIEQPIKAGNRPQMAELCRETPVPIALDEEVIGINTLSAKKELLEVIQPQYVIFKPSLSGGFQGTDEWISICTLLGIQWWITSALESNIGLNAIAQYTYTKNITRPQGLGTGGVFSNNFPSSLQLKGDRLEKKVLKSQD